MRHGVGVGVPCALQHAVGDEGTHGVGAHRRGRGRRLHPDGHRVVVAPPEWSRNSRPVLFYRASPHLRCRSQELTRCHFEGHRAHEERWPRGAAGYHGLRATHLAPQSLHDDRPGGWVRLHRRGVRDLGVRVVPGRITGGPRLVAAAADVHLQRAVRGAAPGVLREGVGARERRQGVAGMGRGNARRVAEAHGLRGRRDGDDVADGDPGRRNGGKRERERRRRVRG